MRRPFTKELLNRAIELYQSGLSLREVSNIIGFDHANIRYNFNKNNVKLRSKKEAIKLSEPKRNKAGSNNPNWKDGISNRIEFKLKLTSYAGGKCVDCNVIANVSNYSIFEFHHLDPQQKDFAIGESRLFKKNQEDIFLEIDKCALLCANCHRLRHQQNKDL